MDYKYIFKEGRQLPQCVVCYKVLSEGSMKPSFLKRHLTGCHPDLADKDVDFFKHKEAGVKRIRLDHGGQLSQQTQAGLRASYMAALRIAKEKKAHTIAENLVLHCCKDIVHCIFGGSAEKKLDSVPLSNDTIKRRITDMADDVEQQVVAEIRGSPLNSFSIQLDESTDVSSCSQLCTCIRVTSKMVISRKSSFLPLVRNNYKRRGCLLAGLRFL